MTADDTAAQESETTEFQWFHNANHGGSPTEHRGPVRWQLLVGFAIGALLFSIGWQHIAMVVFVVTTILVMISWLQPGWFEHIERFLAAAGRWAGLVAGLVLLTPTFYLFFTLARAISWLRRDDPLNLRHDEGPTYWHTADTDKRKVRWYSSMFATERPSGKASGLLGWVGLALLTLLLAEVVVRLIGLGSPVLYVNDPVVGYQPLPQQTIHRLGNTLRFNRYGMRAPEYELEKPHGVIRILMLGDSTLYGGSYVADEELYARRLERMLSERLGRPIEVWNMGVNGWGPFHKTGFVEKHGVFDADLAIVCLPILDVYRRKHQVADDPLATFTLASNAPRFGLSEVWKLVRVKWRSVWKGAAEYNNRAPERAARGIAEYGRLAALLKEAGCREVFVEVLPSRELGLGLGNPIELDGDLKARLEKAVKANAQFNAPSNIFETEASDPEGIYHDACHLDTTGHQLYAEYLWQRLIDTSSTLQEASAEEPIVE